MTTPSKKRVVTVDLHGLRAGDVAPALGDLIDRHQGPNGTGSTGGVVLRVIHGRGTFAIAAEVDRVARVDPRVRSAVRDPENDGVTLLELDPHRALDPRSRARRPYDPEEPPVRRAKRRR